MLTRKSSSVVVMVTVSERLPLLNRFLASLAKYEPTRDVLIYMQGDNRLDDVVIPDGVHANLIYVPERQGCHAARVHALNHLEGAGYSHYINVDDDVELLPQTNWEPALARASEAGVGFVLTNWVRSPKLLPVAIGRMREEFIPAVMVYQGGGMAYTEEVAKLMRELPTVHARFDDIWPLTAYLAGYRNFRYRGSLALHRIMAPGGMSLYMNATPRPLLCAEWINYREAKGRVGRDYAIPTDSDLKIEARKQHTLERERKGWK